MLLLIIYIYILFLDVWPYYYPGLHFIIFVVDSTRPDRIPEAKVLLGDLLANDILYDVDLLILASKCDLPGAVTEVDVADAMQVIFSDMSVW